jgi:ATP adenylyltransferase
MAEHDRLWAPWRLAYITGEAAPDPDEPPPGTCFLCHYLAGPVESDPRRLILERGPLTVSILNRYPYNNGHVLVAPRAHKPDLGDLTSDELMECQSALVRLTRALKTAFQAQGFNVGLNLGSVAGAGLPGHLHWHIVPRWAGDTNFMPVTAGIRVLPQSLEASCELLRAALRDLG